MRMQRGAESADEQSAAHTRLCIQPVNTRRTLFRKPLSDMKRDVSNEMQNLN